MQLARGGGGGGGGGGYCVEKATGFRCGANNTPMEFKGTSVGRRVYERGIFLNLTISVPPPLSTHHFIGIEYLFQVSHYD